MQKTGMNFMKIGIMAIDYDFPNVITEYKSYKKLKEDVESKNSWIV